MANESQKNVRELMADQIDAEVERILQNLRESEKSGLLVRSDAVRTLLTGKKADVYRGINHNGARAVVVTYAPNYEGYQGGTATTVITRSRGDNPTYTCLTTHTHPNNARMLLKVTHPKPTVLQVDDYYAIGGRHGNAKATRTTTVAMADDPTNFRYLQVQGLYGDADRVGRTTANFLSLNGIRVSEAMVTMPRNPSGQLDDLALLGNDEKGIGYYLRESASQLAARLDTGGVVHEWYHRPMKRQLTQLPGIVADDARGVVYVPNGDQWDKFVKRPDVDRYGYSITDGLPVEIKLDSDPTRLAIGKFNFSGIVDLPRKINVDQIRAGFNL